MSGCHPTRLFCGVSIIKAYVFDVSKGVFDLVTGSFVVDVICKAGFVRGIEDDKIQLVLPDTTPTADT